MAKVAIDVSNADNAVELAKRRLERVKWSCSLGAHPDAHAPSPSFIEPLVRRDQECVAVIGGVKGVEKIAYLSELRRLHEWPGREKSKKN
jgi:hypothetical protein